MTIDVSIVIVNFNSGQYLKNCLESIYNCTKGVSFEIILVDNASTDGSFEKIREDFTSIFGLKNDSNLGFAAANNIGAKSAQGKYLLFLNPDTLLVDDAISAMYQFLESADNMVAACGARLQNPDGTYSVSFGNFPTLFQQFSDIGFRAIYKRYYDRKLSISPPCNFTDPQPVGYLSGADTFIRKDIFLKLGGFDEAYFMYYEDTDLFYRLHKAGYQSYLLPEVSITHIGSSTSDSDGTFNYSKYSMLEKSKYLYFAKNHGACSVFWAKTFQTFSLLFHVGKFHYSLKKMLRITWLPSSEVSSPRRRGSRP